MLASVCLYSSHRRVLSTIRGYEHASQSILQHLIYFLQGLVNVIIYIITCVWAWEFSSPLGDIQHQWVRQPARQEQLLLSECHLMTPPAALWSICPLYRQAFTRSRCISIYNAEIFQVLSNALLYDITDDAHIANITPRYTIIALITYFHFAYNIQCPISFQRLGPNIKIPRCIMNIIINWWYFHIV